MLIAAFVFHSEVLPVLFTTTILLLVILGAVAAKAGWGCIHDKGRSRRSLFWGALSMITTTLIGYLLGHAGV